MKAESINLVHSLLKAGSDMFRSIACDGVQLSQAFVNEAKSIGKDAFASFVKTQTSDSTSASSEEKEYWQYQNHGDPMHIYSINDGDGHDHHKSS